MKVAVTSEGTELASPVDPRFGRAKYFVVADLDTEGVETVDNLQNVNAAQGAGIQSAENVSRRGAEAVLTGHCGPNAYRALSAAGIAVYTGAAGTVQDALAAFQAGNLQKADSADVGGHW